MPENTTKTPPEVKYNIKRNEIEAPFVMVEKSRGPEKTPIVDGKPDIAALLKGEQYPAPYVTPDNLVTIWLPWLGLDVATAKIQAFLNAWAQRIMESTKEQNNGQFNELTWLQFAPELSFRGEKLSVLQENLLDVLEKAQNYDMDTVDGLKMVKQLMGEASKLRVMIRDKKRSPREAKEASTDDAVNAATA